MNKCLNCGKRWTTYETVETNPMIVTNVDNMREPFKREKLTDSIKHATYCVDMSVEIEDIVNKIENELEYPGQIKVNIIRESRAVDFAK